MSARPAARPLTSASASIRPAWAGAYTGRCRPVVPVFVEQFASITDAIAAERRIKGWSRAKKEALIRGEWALVQWLAKRPGARERIGSAAER